MSKIKFRLEKFEMALVFQVLEMDERFRCIDGDEFKKFYPKEIYLLPIVSDTEPLICPNKIDLRGRMRGADLSVDYIEFKNNEERDKYFDRAIKSIKHWAENWEGWKDDATPEKSDGGYFEF